MAAVTTAVIGIASGVASAASSFKAASDAKNAQTKADSEAKKAMEAAKAKAQVDNYSGLSVPLDAYEAEFENNLAVAQQNTEALQEGDARALAGGVGRIGAAAGANAEGTRIAMGEEISDMNKMKADSKEAINQQLISMDVAYAKEQNQRSADAQVARSQGISQGIAGVSGALTSAASLAPLYGQSVSDKRGSKLAKQYADQKPEGMTDAQFAAKLGANNYSKDQYKQLRDAEKGRARWNFKDERFDFQSDLGMDYMKS